MSATERPGHDGPGPTTLDQLISALDTAVLDVVHGAPGGTALPVESVILVDGDDLGADYEASTPVPHVFILVGVCVEEVIGWLDAVAARPSERRPVALLTKLADPAVAHEAQRAGVTLLLIHPKARWNHIFSTVERMLDRNWSRSLSNTSDSDLLATDTDLFELAQMVARNAGGLVSIEDARSKVLAYSASDDSADELRTLSIMGREGPREYLRALQQSGVFDRIRDTDEVVDVPARADLNTRRRLVVGIRDSSTPRTARQLLGSIWIQEAAEPFSVDAANVLRGAAAMAARIIARSLNAPTTEGLLTQRLFGARGDGVDIPSVAGALGLPVNGPAAVIGFAALVDDGLDTGGGFANLLRLHASSFRGDAVVTVIGPRAYVLIPQYKSARSVNAWTHSIVDHFEGKRSVQLRAAIALPVADLSGVAPARAEVDRVLDASRTLPQGERVTTLAESLTPVLLGEILDVAAAVAALADPRLVALDDYDASHDGSLRASVRAYLAAYGDVRTAAHAVNVHPNTLRYRLRRVEEILGIDLSRRDDRLLLELQLAMRDRTVAAG